MPADRRDLRRRLFSQAAEQGGYFTAAQAKEIGYSYQAQAHHVGAGNWLRIDRGLFRLAEWVPDLHDDLVRWTLWSKGRAVVSHESALSVHEIGELESPRVQLTVPPGFRMRDPAVVLHPAELPQGDVVERTGFRLTSVVRSLVDAAAGTADDDQLARAIQEARVAGLLTLRQLRTRAEAVDLRAALRIERAIHSQESCDLRDAAGAALGRLPAAAVLVLASAATGARVVAADLGPRVHRMDSGADPARLARPGLQAIPGGPGVVRTTGHLVERGQGHQGVLDLVGLAALDRQVGGVLVGGLGCSASPMA